MFFHCPWKIKNNNWFFLVRIGDIGMLSPPNIEGMVISDEILGEPRLSFTAFFIYEPNDLSIVLMQQIM